MQANAGVDTRPNLALKLLPNLISTPTSVDTRPNLALKSLPKLVSTLPKLLPNPLALLDLVVTAGPRRGCNPLIKLPHSMGVGAAGPARAQSSC